jgi:two-component system sensor histidine kinase BaeS
MRLRLVHTLSLLLLLAVALSLLATGLLYAWNLRNGFADYRRARDREQLEQFAGFVAGQLANADSGSGSQIGRLELDVWLREFGGRQGFRPESPPGPPPAADPPPAGLLPGGRDGLAARIAVLDPQGRRLAGRDVPEGADTDLQPVIVAGHTAALLRLAPGGPPDDAVDTRFLRRQYLGIAAISAVLLSLAVAAAAWIARRWAQPLLAMQSATARIAQGDTSVQLREQGSVEMAETVRNINAMSVALQRMEGARRRWLADISHELRTPLTVLRGELDALHDGVRPMDAAALQSLREETQRLGALVDDLHLLAMADLRALPCHFTSLDATALLRQTVQRFAPRAAQYGLQLECELPLAVQTAVWDGARIGQLIDNLLHNSLRYSDAPGRVRLTLTAQDEALRIVVEDSPPGVSDEQLRHLFEPLYRTDAARSRDAGGSGLGLAICAAIAHAHRGHIVAQRSPLGGLAVVVTLPRSVTT